MWMQVGRKYNVCACIQRTQPSHNILKHEKYSLQTKAQKTADKNIFERQVKLQADSRRIRCTRDSITISIG